HGADSLEFDDVMGRRSESHGVLPWDSERAYGRHGLAQRRQVRPESYVYDPSVARVQLSSGSSKPRYPASVSLVEYGIACTLPARCSPAESPPWSSTVWLVLSTHPA